jgi:intracellular septation protein A
MLIFGNVTSFDGEIEYVQFKLEVKYALSGADMIICSYRGTEL